MEIDDGIELSKWESFTLFHQVYVKGCHYSDFTAMYLSCPAFHSCQFLFFYTVSRLCPLHVPGGNKKKKMWHYLGLDVKRIRESFLRSLFPLLCFQPQLSKSKQHCSVEGKYRLPAQVQRLSLCLRIV